MCILFMRSIIVAILKKNSFIFARYAVFFVFFFNERIVKASMTIIGLLLIHKFGR